MNVKGAFVWTGTRTVDLKEAGRGHRTRRAHALPLSKAEVLVKRLTEITIDHFVCCAHDYNQPRAQLIVISPGIVELDLRGFATYTFHSSLQNDANHMYTLRWQPKTGNRPERLRHGDYM